MNDQQSGWPQRAPYSQGVDPSLLVGGPFAVTMGNRGTPPLPSQALVFTTDDGTVVELPRLPSAMGSFKYRYRYEVDTSDHRSSWMEVLPSGTGGYCFQASLDTTWTVTAPSEVVRRNISTVADGDATVALAIRNLLWPHAGLYPIDRLADFDAFVRSSFCAGCHSLPEGLTVSALTVGLSLDQEATDHLRALRQAAERQRLLQVEHQTDRTRQQLEQVLQADRENAIRQAAQGDGGILIHLIAQDPGKLREIMLDLGQRQDVAAERKIKTLRDLIEAKLIQPAEAQQMWQDMHSPAPLLGPEPSAALQQTAPPAQLMPGAFSPSPMPSAAPSLPYSPTSSATNYPAVPSPSVPQAQVVAGVVLGPTLNPVPPRPRVRSFEQPPPGTPAAPAPAPRETPVAPAADAPHGPAAQTPAIRGPAAQGPAAQTPPPDTPASAPGPAAPLTQQADTGGGSSNVVGTTPVGSNRRPRKDGKRT
ncbi:hypothetical protein ACFYW8_32610 [Streptomyces sp. NPDC002742]|uniref:hypothetical protein n=1 Tax=Streptomyces sp. NPDC002742 TaxID=3364663 RepID=UPI003675B1DF